MNDEPVRPARSDAQLIRQQLRERLLRALPGLRGMRQAPAGSGRDDLFAGLVLSVALVPVGLAYAVAAGLPPIVGLYATVAGLLVHAFVGPSRPLVIGPDSALVALTLGVVGPLAGGDPVRAASLAAMQALLAGLICMAAGAARLGVVTELLSKPIRHGFMNGIAITVIVGQLPALIGAPRPGASIVETLVGLAGALVGENVHLVAVAIGLGALTLLWAMRRVGGGLGWPGALAVVVGSTLLATLLDLPARTGLAVVGDVPQGLPQLHWPAIGWQDLGPVGVGALAIALVAFADTSVLARALAGRTGERVDIDRVMIGLGAANVAAGLWQGMPVSASGTRTSVALAAGARTPRVHLVGAAMVALMLWLAPSLLRHLPATTLAAIVIAAAWTLVEVDELRRLRRIQPSEFWLAIGCTAGVILLGPLPGIGLAVGVALVEFLWNAWRPYWAVLGRVDGLKGYHDIARHPQARRIPGLVLLRWDAPLFFANAEWFRDIALQVVDQAPQPVHWLVVGAEPVTRIDVSAADVLVQLDDTLRERGISLRFAGMKDPVKDQLHRYGVFERFGEPRFFATLGETVGAYVARHDVDWIDWEDRAPVPPAEGRIPVDILARPPEVPSRNAP